MENTIIINFNNLLDFGILIQHVKVVGNQILLQIERHPSGNYKLTSNFVEIEKLFGIHF